MAVQLDAMLRALAPGLLICSLFVSPSSADNGFHRCNCEDEGAFWSIESILETQRVSDFLIAVAYFSIPIELIYFVSCSNVPFKCVLFQFISFIVLCGMTHLLNGWTYGPHSFQLMMAVTVFKMLTALVSCATAITLFTMIPLLLKVKVREFMLKKKAWDLGREVGLIMKKKETGLHVRMLTQEIRKSLNKHTILDTTLVELSKTLGLHNCAVWMPNEDKTEMHLTHQLNGMNYSGDYTIPITDSDIVRIQESDDVNLLSPDSALVTASSRHNGETGPVAAIRMPPMFLASSFKEGSSEIMENCYAILVCILPNGRHPTSWSNQELEIVKVVADQVAVAISHATALEESQLIRQKLEEQNRALQSAKQEAMRASQARNAFLNVMSDGMRKPMHSISGLLSVMQSENLNRDQQIIVDAMMKTSNVISTLVNDVMDISVEDSGRFQQEIRPFKLHSMIREAASVAKCLCVYKGFGFSIQVERSLPDYVIGDERRVFQVLLHMVGSLLDGSNGRGAIMFRSVFDNGSLERNERRWTARRHGNSDGGVYIRFEIGIGSSNYQSEGSTSEVQFGDQRFTSGAQDRLSFSMCQKLVQMMHGNIWVIQNPNSSAQSMALVLRFQVRPSLAISITEAGDSSEQPYSNSLLNGLQVLLADNDDGNRAVTRKLLEKLGCSVSSVSSGFQCLSAVGPSASPFQIVMLDLHLPDLDGYEVAMRIRKYHSRSWPLIVFTTASADEAVWEKCAPIGINGVIRKPVLLQGLAKELRRLLIQANQFSR